ncbi:MAG: hypothetical protein HS099_11005 [Ardenticatenaceae bacterium]|nr:hypothetical protein [Ardenticatenaceae bacterium]
MSRLRLSRPGCGCGRARGEMARNDGLRCGHRFAAPSRPYDSPSVVGAGQAGELLAVRQYLDSACLAPFWLFAAPGRDGAGTGDSGGGGFAAPSRPYGL